MSKKVGLKVWSVVIVGVLLSELQAAGGPGLISAPASHLSLPGTQQGKPIGVAPVGLVPSATFPTVTTPIVPVVGAPLKNPVIPLSSTVVPTLTSSPSGSVSSAVGGSITHTPIGGTVSPSVALPTTTAPIVPGALAATPVPLGTTSLPAPAVNSVTSPIVAAPIITSSATSIVPPASSSSSTNIITPQVTGGLAPSVLSGDVGIRKVEDKPVTVVEGHDADVDVTKNVAQGIDTLGIDKGGNWLLKRKIWEDTEDVYQQIKDVSNKVLNTRVEFIHMHNDLDREADIFYGQIGTEQGRLQDIVAQVKMLMEKEKIQQGSLNEKERALVTKLAGKERDLEQLGKDIKAINELDQKVNEALDVLFKQMEVCDGYEQKAWENFKEIARQLDDKEARKLFYETQSILKDCQSIFDYITKDFNDYFHQTVQSMRDHMQKVSAQMKALYQDGINLNKEAELLEKDDLPVAKKAEDVPKKDIKPVSQEQKSDKGDQLSGLLEKVKHYGGVVLTAVKSAYDVVHVKVASLLAKWFVSKAVSKDESKKDVAVLPVAVDKATPTTMNNVPAQATGAKQEVQASISQGPSHGKDDLVDDPESFEF